MIDNPVLLTFCNESARAMADLLAGLLPAPQRVIDSAIGKGIPAILGTTAEALLRSQPWETSDYAAITLHDIQGSGDGGRATLTNHDAIALLRVLVVLQQMMDANPALGPLIQKIAVNPRV